MPPAYVPYRIAKIIDETEDIRTFRLVPSPPAQVPQVPGASAAPQIPSFKAGQFFMLRMANAPPELKPPFRSYSCLCPPGNPFLEFGIKKHGAFTTLLFSMKEGDAIEVAGPYGVFTLPDALTDSTPLVFLAGGIGITPLLCMSHHLVQSGHGGKFFLFYSNRHENEIAYKGLIDSLSDLNPNFTPVYSLTCDDKECPASWEGEMGRINAAMLKKHLNGNGADGAPPFALPACHYFLCGSPPFVAALIEMLKGEGVMAENIHKEQW